MGSNRSNKRVTDLLNYCYHIYLYILYTYTIGNKSNKIYTYTPTILFNYSRREGHARL